MVGLLSSSLFFSECVSAYVFDGIFELYMTVGSGIKWYAEGKASVVRYNVILYNTGLFRFRGSDILSESSESGLEKCPNWVTSQNSYSKLRNFSQESCH